MTPVGGTPLLPSGNGPGPCVPFNEAWLFLQHLHDKLLAHRVAEGL